MRCSAQGAKRCGRDATHWIIAPDGERVPGGYICEDHGRVVIDEYLQKLGETWRLQGIDQYGAPIRGVFIEPRDATSTTSRADEVLRDGKPEHMFDLGQE